MTFDGLVDRLVSLYDVTTQRAADVANERLGRMLARSKSLRSIRSLGTTVAGQTSYALDPGVVQVLNAQVVYSDGQVNYKGDISISDLWNVDAGTGELDQCQAYVAIEPDADSSLTTDNLRLWPTPGESGKTITGLVVLRATDLVYGSASALPIPEDAEEALLAGCKAELSDEEGSDSSKFELVFAAGIKDLAGDTNERGVGAGGHRIRVVGYDVR